MPEIFAQLNLPIGVSAYVLLAMPAVFTLLTMVNLVACRCRRVLSHLLVCLTLYYSSSKHLLSLLLALVLPRGVPVKACGSSCAANGS